MRPPEAGAIPERGGTTFRTWAPHAERVQVRFSAAGDPRPQSKVLRALGGGWFEEHVLDAGPGTLYQFVLDDRVLPDPYARFLPFGVHGRAEVIARERARPFEAVAPRGADVIYELHIGTFTSEGTYASARERLQTLVDLGVTAIELMPLAAFPGERGWGYDGVAPFAPFAPYGRPEQLRALIEQAHGLGLVVLLDVVYNHFGPRGNYLAAYAKDYFTAALGNPWGNAPDFGVPAMRRLVLDNARMWFDEYGFDGLRLDATHSLRDESPVHILRELRDIAAHYQPAKILIAEDERNDPRIITDIGLSAVWADDFHHQVRVLLTGERDGYYGSYAPTVEGLARTIERGWTFEGQWYEPWNAPRGKSAEALETHHFVYCVENHDQVGNRALGERLDRDSSPAALRAATIVLLFLPMTPMLFMGQEWASSSPFLFFCDHDEEYGPIVSKGRREEFRRFKAFADPEARARIPDPQSRETFERSKLDWEERAREPHRSLIEDIRALLRLRREDPVLRSPCARANLQAWARNGTLLIERSGPAGRRSLVANLAPQSAVREGAAVKGEPLLVIGDVAPDTLGPFSAVIYEPL